jgi:hypothetical protein
MQTLKAGLLYFTLVFGAGFVLGPIRILWLVPRVGPRTAELMEAPIMLAVIIFAARWVVRRLALPPTPSQRLGMGVVALGSLDSLVALGKGDSPLFLLSARVTVEISP